MAEENKNITTALAIVEEQQKVVGSALVAASGTAVLAENTDTSTEILEQIRFIQVNTLRGINEVVSTMKEMFAFEKLQDRRLKEDQTETNKENMGNVNDVSGGKGNDINPQDADKKTGGMFAFLGGIPGAGFFKKMLAPILAFFGKGGLLVKLFGKFGPLGALILGFTLVYKYADEIAKALAPAIDKIKELIVKLQPAIDVLKQFGDFLMKGIIEGIGEALSFVLGTVEKFIDGFKKLFSKDTFFEGLNDIFEGIVRTILAVPLMIVNFLKPLFLDLVDMIAEPWDNMVINVNQYISDTFTAIKDYFIELKDKIIGFFVEAYESVKTTITDAVQGMFAPIVDFFTSIGDKIKSAINGIIDALPLPDFIKNKIKLETKASKEAGNRIDETGVKSKYVDDTITGMQRERMTGGIATMGEASAEFAGEKYGTAKITKSGTSGYDSVSAIMTPEEFTEYNKLDTNGQMDYLKALDDKEQERREMIKKLHEDKLEFDIANQDYINKYKTAPDEMMSPDDQMLRDDKFQREAKIQASTISNLDNNNQGAVTVVNNNYNTNNSSVANQTDVHSGSLDTGIDSYHDKLATASA